MAANSIGDNFMNDVYSAIDKNVNISLSEGRQINLLIYPARPVVDKLISLILGG
jgi:hypothetical protein